MGDPKGHLLFVNLGASQARRRLKGFGHGVRKVQTNGRDRAVVIHTATGRHLDELKRKFDDVGCSTNEADVGVSVATLKNIGPPLVGWLREIRVKTVADLERLGPVTAYRLIRNAHPEANRRVLWSLAAGLRDLAWQDLPETVKERLTAELES
ncbi:MAG: TfoX/Sxy family DNA transformation protein [Planctomycetaceae bacterium]|nr:TfoX/Sxy family DNA transformation protein [Planctomycetaceae bacterium]